MGKIVIYKGGFQYDVVNMFAEELCEGFIALGKDAVVVDILKKEENTIISLLSDSCDAVISFNAIGALTRNGASVYDLFDVPFIALLVDHPFYHYDRFKDIENCTVTCLDLSHIRCLKRVLPRMKTLHLPHAGSLGEENLCCDKDIDILFAGTYIGSEEEAKQKLQGAKNPVLQKIFEDIVQANLDDDAQALDEMFLKYAEEKKITMDNAGMLLLECRTGLNISDFVIRNIKRLRALKILDDAGVTVDIYGDNWPDDLFVNHRIHDAVPFKDVLSLMNRSKLVLDLSFYPEGTHERIFSAMLNGACVLTDYNPYLESIPMINTFKWKDLKQLPERVEALVADSADSFEERAIMQEYAKKHHTWKNRAAKLLESGFLN
ncbi:MAG: glycosyltransferase family 1 protein [Waddliaceae bacterium]|nr:glycosyltransferase family 1 protein [Waddliaceae bacterium]MBT3579039.1 glycosyltransferase family 1 protein [Waddliaceae bacterium]MBT4445421.1 glycosyltransferase family 1 protein [Waddliaceae bacterium]MBT6928820.1 glycosyltransferase family 1 protein [Waddliaceae bacterium]MBT7263958.1 glycosyltransferase family 1 protein [Waddliaceae bacterium]